MDANNFPAKLKKLASLFFCFAVMLQGFEITFIIYKFRQSTLAVQKPTKKAKTTN